MKIAIVSSSLPPLSSGGVSTAQFGLYSLLKQNETYNVKCFTFLDREPGYYSEPDKNIERSGVPRFISIIISLCCTLFFKVIDRRKNSYQTSDILQSMFGAIQGGIKIRKFQPDVVFISDHGAPMFFIKPFVKSKFIWMAHHNPMRFLSNPLIGNMSTIDAVFATYIEKLCIKNCEWVISPSQYMNDFIKNSHLISIKQCVIPNIINLNFLSAIDAVEPVKESVDNYKVFIPSAGSKVKGERYIYSIMDYISSRLKDKHVSFYLSGKISNELKFEIAQNSKLSCVILGHLEYKKNIAYMKSCNLMLSPTLLESYGMAILEATLSGIPVVAFDVGGNQDLIFEGENGSLVKFLHVNELCEKALQLISEPLDKKRVIAISEEKYSLNTISRDLNEIIVSLNNEQKA